MNAYRKTRNEQCHVSSIGMGCSKRERGAGSVVRLLPKLDKSEILSSDERALIAPAKGRIRASAWERLLLELNRRKVLHGAGSYIVYSWLSAQVIDLASDGFGLPEWVLPLYLAALFLGFPIFLVLAWVFAVTPKGIFYEKSLRDWEIPPSQRNWVDLAITCVLISVIVLLLMHASEEPVREISGEARSFGIRIN